MYFCKFSIEFARAAVAQYTDNQFQATIDHPSKSVRKGHFTVTDQPQTQTQTQTEAQTQLATDPTDSPTTKPRPGVFIALLIGMAQSTPAPA